MATYSVYEKIPGKVWRFIDSVDANSGAAAVRSVKASMRRRGNSAPSGTKYKATREKSNPAPKLGKWIQAKRVRIVKVNGAKVLEIQRTVKKRKAKKRIR